MKASFVLAFSLNIKTGMFNIRYVGFITQIIAENTKLGISCKTSMRLRSSFHEERSLIRGGIVVNF